MTRIHFDAGLRIIPHEDAPPDTYAVTGCKSQVESKFATTDPTRVDCPECLKSLATDVATALSPNPTGCYILDEDRATPIPCPDPVKWGLWMKATDRHVADTEIAPNVHVSTVFLGMDHSFAEVSACDPILWETMVFGGPLDQEMDRYTSRADALEGHARMVEKAKEEG